MADFLVRGERRVSVQRHAARPWGWYAAKIRDLWKKTSVWLGMFDSVEDAAWAYDAAVLSLRGPKAKINLLMTGSQMADFWVWDKGRVLVQRYAARPTTTTTAFEIDGFKKILN
jgi:hypothetical protein